MDITSVVFNNTEQLQARLKVARLARQRVDFVSCLFKNVDFKRIAIGEIDSFKSCSFRSCSFSELRLQNILFKECELMDVTFNQAICFGSTVFSRCYFNCCNFRKAVLRGVKFKRPQGMVEVIGDGKNIITLQLPKWNVTIVGKYMQIGCQLHKIKKWFKFSNEKIFNMSPSAPEWWNTWKPFIEAVIKVKAQQASHE